MVIRPIRERDQDGKPYIYVGVSRRDCPGIVQAGIAGDLVYRLGGYSRGFAVVAVEIRKLAEHAKEATKEINVLISGIQKSVAESIAVMEDGTRHIESGSAQAAQAGKSLAAILETSESVQQQVEEIVAAMHHMSKSSNELMKVMQAVNRVTEENTTATRALAVGSNEVTQAIESIASISEENSAALEEVSASTEEVSAQVEQVSASAASLMNMAQELQQVIAQFKLNRVGTNHVAEQDDFLALAIP
jgi:methyl-accepting chemotaxis protein